MRFVQAGEMMPCGDGQWMTRRATMIDAGLAQEWARRAGKAVRGHGGNGSANNVCGWWSRRGEAQESR
jgi:hypothetical protein